MKYLVVISWSMSMEYLETHYKTFNDVLWDTKWHTKIGIYPSTSVRCCGKFLDFLRLILQIIAKVIKVSKCFFLLFFFFLKLSRWEYIQIKIRQVLHGWEGRILMIEILFMLWMWRTRGSRMSDVGDTFFWWWIPLF